MIWEIVCVVAGKLDFETYWCYELAYGQSFACVGISDCPAGSR